MQIVIYAAIAVVVLLVAFVAFVASRPDTFHIERSGPVNAPVEVPFSLVNDLHAWARWSPFEKFDPNMKKTFEGPPAGPGAIFGWSGNSKAGEGRITILETKPFERILIKLDFFRPFKATNQATFTFIPADGGTRVTWGIDGKKNFMLKMVHLFMDMDQMIGKDFEEGLANLNNVARNDTIKAL